MFSYLILSLAFKERALLFCSPVLSSPNYPSPYFFQSPPEHLQSQNVLSYAQVLAFFTIDVLSYRIYPLTSLNFGLLLVVALLLLLPIAVSISFLYVSIQSAIFYLFFSLSLTLSQYLLHYLLSILTKALVPLLNFSRNLLYQLTLY